MVVFVLRQAQRELDGVIVSLRRKNIFGIGVRTRGEEIEQLIDAEAGRKNLGEHLSQSQSVGRQNLPRVGRGGRAEPCEQGEPVQVRSQEIDELAVPMFAWMVAPGMA